MYRIRLILIAVFTVLMITSVSNAQDPQRRLFGLSSDQPGGIFSINPLTGNAVQVITLNGDSSFVGLSFIEGTFYGSDLEKFPGSGDNFNVGSIDEDGVITFVSDQEGSSNWWGLASDDCDEGVLYAIDNDTEPDYPLKELLPDGSLRDIGPTGVDAAGMAYDDENGILYALEGDTPNANLYTISTFNGNSQLIGPSGLTSGTIDLGLAYDEINKVLYAVDGTENNLYTLNTTTGQASLVGPLGLEGVGIDGLAWRDACRKPIPTLSEWGLIAMSGVIGLAGLIAVRRRKAAV